MGIKSKALKALRNPLLIPYAIKKRISRFYKLHIIKDEFTVAITKWFRDPVKFNRVISVCSAKDLSVWNVTASHLIKFISAVEFVVIVPETDLEQFQAVTPHPIKVINEKKYTDQVHKLLKPKFNEQNKGRYGWYLQQFIKLIALSEAKSDETYLIWDADTVPLKPLVFHSSNKLSYYTGTERHLPYFETISRLLGLKKIVSHSFIAQCFPARGAWIKEFISVIESRKGLPWLEAIVEATDFRESSGFSEYETLGTFFSHRYANEIHFTRRKWLRSGSSLIGGIDNLHQPLSKLMLFQFDYAAFETWDKPSKRNIYMLFIINLIRKVPIAKRIASYNRKLWNLL